ncbi:unnamed protein product [Symbiodinium sp. CCMP2592]|nr:unnamed protein product [Symbiodinium sp. CCMP2592]
MLGLQADPPGGLYQDVPGLPNPAARAFSPLADQKWVTIALSFLKEVETITARRGELAPPALPKPAAEEQLSKKQARAAAWAAKRAAASNHPVEDSPLRPGREFSFCLWASSLVRLVLKSGTAFGRFLGTTLPLCRDPDLEVATALYPLPIPFEGLFQKRSRRRNVKRRRTHLIKVVVFTVVMSLNFLHSGGKHIPHLFLRRPPSSAQSSAFGHLEELVRASARLGGECIQSGRRGLQLAARQAEVLHFLRAAGLDEDCYFAKGARAADVPEFAEDFVPHMPGGPAELNPYRDLDAERITRLTCPAYSHALYGSCVDRRDFYHQARVSNAIGPVFCLRDFYGAQAYIDFLAGADSAFRAGTPLGSWKLPSPLLADSKLLVHGSFKSILQGDHAGVEYACAGHEGLLRAAGVLGLLRRLAKEAYAREGVPGSDNKDVDASAETVASGKVLVGLPVPRRLALSQASLLVAQGRWISEELASILVGCWVTALMYRNPLLFALGKKDLAVLAVLAPVMVWPSHLRGRGTPVVVEHLWQTADQKGWYTRLAAEPEDTDECIASESRPERPVASRYDFLEVCWGGPWLSVLLSDRLCVGPVVDFHASPFFSIVDPRCLEWILYMLQERRLKSVLVVPPVGSFSPAFQPRLRSWDPHHRASCHPRLRRENAILNAAICILLVASRCNAYALLLHPLLSFARSLHPKGRCRAVALVAAPGAHDLAPLISKPRAGPPSFANVLADSLAALVRQASDQPSPAQGLEGILFNDVMLTSRWKVRRSWPWRDHVHINLLEARSFLCALRDRARAGLSSRFVHGLDSYVALGALQKGRTSSQRLLPVVKQSAAVQVAFDQYPGLLFSPTRLNTSDDPTRSVALRAPVPASLLTGLPSEDLYGLACLGGLSRASANLVRLVLLYFSLRTGSGCGSLVRSLTLRPRDLLPLQSLTSHACDPVVALDFDSTLGYPGEGPSQQNWRAAADGGLQPRDVRGASRALARQGLELGEGRPILDRTSKNRQQLLEAFDQWLRSCGFSLEDLLGTRPLDPENIAAWLVAYGRQLFGAGRPYWHYSESINAVAALRPAIRRSLQGAWDLAFSCAKEPATHHVAMPPVVLLALLCTCLFWGWLREAGIFAMSWGGLLRIGEATATTRQNLVLPADVLFSHAYILVRIEEPKTRMRMARHQSARIEHSDLVDLVTLAFKDVERGSRLWPQSTQTLRRRFDLALERIGLPTQRRGTRPLDLGYFRPGGATHLMVTTEDSDLVRTRGRWASQKVMEIYIQEVAASLYFPSLPLELRQRIMDLAQAFTSVLEQVKEWKNIGVPPSSWYAMFTAGKRPNSG